MINDETGGPVGANFGRMIVGLQQLDEFEKRVQGVLDHLMAGPMRDKPAGEPLAAGGYGSGFAESEFVQNAIGNVVLQLEDLARQLRAQIEVMRLSVRMAGSKTAETDEGNRAAIARALTETYRSPKGSGDAHPVTTSRGGDSGRGID